MVMACKIFTSPPTWTETLYRNKGNYQFEDPSPTRRGVADSVAGRPASRLAASTAMGGVDI